MKVNTERLPVRKRYRVGQGNKVDVTWQLEFRKMLQNADSIHRAPHSEQVLFSNTASKVNSDSSWAPLWALGHR